MGWFRWIARLLFAWLLKRGPVPLFVRLGTSQHLGDYQFIGLCALVLAAVVLVLGATHTGLEAWIASRLASLGIHLSNPPPIAIVFGLLATTTTLASWVYQSANKRLGTVDLFACEISSLCRVGLVTDFAQKSIHMQDMWPAKGKRKATPIDIKESFTPVHDKNTSDLQTLDTNSVTSITSFYTYRKTMMEYLRHAYAAPTWESWHEYYKQMIYMQFLMYENARLAILELTEFEPERAQNLVTIYCSELPLFTCLLERYRRSDSSDFLYERLRMRIKDYDRDVQELLNKLDDIGRYRSGKHDPDSAWIKAKTTAQELDLRFGKFQEATREDKRRSTKQASEGEIRIPAEYSVKSAKRAAGRRHANGRGHGTSRRAPPPPPPSNGTRPHH